MIDLPKKEPLPGKETASSDSSVPTAGSSATVGRHARVPEWLITPKHCDELRRGIWLLIFLLRHCDWNTGIWRGTEEKLAEALGMKDRTIRNWLIKLEDLGVSRKRYPYSIEVQLPSELIPNKIGKTKASDRKSGGSRVAKPQQVIGKNTATLAEMKASLASKFDVHKK